MAGQTVRIVIEAADLTVGAAWSKPGWTTR
jgi:hypothetical protein